MGNFFLFGTFFNRKKHENHSKHPKQKEEKFSVVPKKFRVGPKKVRLVGFPETRHFFFGLKGQFSHHNYVTIKSMKNYNVEKFIGSLVQADWSTVFTAVTVNEAWENFKIIFLKVLDNIAPVKQIRLKQKTEPWLTAEILELIKIRDMFLYKFRKEKNSDFISNFVFIEIKFKKKSKLQNLISFQINWKKIKITPKSCGSK